MQDTLNDKVKAKIKKKLLAGWPPRLVYNHMKSMKYEVKETNIFKIAKELDILNEFNNSKLTPQFPWDGSRKVNGKVSIPLHYERLKNE
jgi:hypothetical protein